MMQDYELHCPACGNLLNDGVNCSMWYQGRAIVSDGCPLDGTYSCVNCVKNFIRATEIGYQTKNNRTGWRTMVTKDMLSYAKHEWTPLRDRAWHLANAFKFATCPNPNPCHVHEPTAAAAPAKEPAAAPAKDPAAAPDKTLKVRTRMQFAPGLVTIRELLYRIPKSAVRSAKKRRGGTSSDRPKKRGRAPKRQPVRQCINPLTMGQVLRASEEFKTAAQNATEATGAAASAFSDMKQIADSMDLLTDALSALHHQQKALTVVLAKSIEKDKELASREAITNRRLGNCETMLKNLEQMVKDLLEGRRLTDGARFKYTSFTNKSNKA